MLDECQGKTALHRAGALQQFYDLFDDFLFVHVGLLFPFYGQFAKICRFLFRCVNYKTTNGCIQFAKQRIFPGNIWKVMTGKDLFLGQYAV